MQDPYPEVTLRYLWHRSTQYKVAICLAYLPHLVVLRLVWLYLSLPR